MPPDSGSTSSSARSVSWAKSSSSAALARTLRLGQAEVAAVDVQVLPDGELGVEVVLLRDDAEPGADARAVAVGVHAQDAQLAVRARGDAADHPHRGGLAGAVRPEEAERLPAPDLDVDAADRGEVAEALDQPACLYECPVVSHVRETRGTP